MRPTRIDIENRLRVIKFKLKEISLDLDKYLSYGMSATNCTIEKYQLLHRLYEAIECYDPDIGDDFNCFTIDEINQIFDYISSTYQICFPEYEGSGINDGIFDFTFDTTFN